MPTREGGWTLISWDTIFLSPPQFKISPENLSYVLWFHTNISASCKRSRLGFCFPSFLQIFKIEHGQRCKRIGLSQRTMGKGSWAWLLLCWSISFIFGDCPGCGDDSPSDQSWDRLLAAIMNLQPFFRTAVGLRERHTAHMTQLDISHLNAGKLIPPPLSLKWRDVIQLFKIFSSVSGYLNK